MDGGLQQLRGAGVEAILFGECFSRLSPYSLDFDVPKWSLVARDERALGNRAVFHFVLGIVRPFWLAHFS